MSNDNVTNNPSPSGKLKVERWAAWTSGVESAEEWRAFLAQPQESPNSASVAMADVSEFLTGMQRRRLSPLARAVFKVALKCVAKGECLPSIFCSVYGETQRTYSILETIAESEAVSPMDFSLSVHSAISGQFTILSNNTKPTITLSPSDQSYLSAFAEAYGILNEGAEAVLVVCYEEQLPDLYQPYVVSSNSPLAVAFKLRLGEARAGESCHNLSFEGLNTLEDDSRLPLLELISYFAENRTVLTQAGWQLSTL